MELEQSTLADKIMGLIQSSAWVPKLDMKHLKKTKGHIG